MRRLFKAFLFFASSLLFLTLGAVLFVVTILNPKIRQRIVSHLVVVWSITTLRILDISVSFPISGPVHHAGMLIVCNHQSYLDIIVLASTMPMLFVAKKDVRAWPLLGWLASLGGTLYIDREAFRGANNALEKIVDTLRNNVNVLLFPEGTSGNGERILPFKPSLFRSVVTAERVLLPVTLNYVSIGGSDVDRTNRDTLCWYGDMTFADHFWGLLNVHSVTVSVSVHSPIIQTADTDAKQLCESAFSTVLKGFRPIV